MKDRSDVDATRLIAQPSSADEYVTLFKLPNPSNTDDEPSARHSKSTKVAPTSPKGKGKGYQVGAGHTTCGARPTTRYGRYARAYPRPSPRRAATLPSGRRWTRACVPLPPPTIPPTNIGGRTSASRHSSRPCCRRRGHRLGGRNLRAVSSASKALKRRLLLEDHVVTDCINKVGFWHNQSPKDSLFTYP
jgi:hypothetical protein